MSNSLTQVSTQPLVENFATLTCSSSTKDNPWGWLVSISTHQPMPVLTPGGDGPYSRQENEGIGELCQEESSTLLSDLQFSSPGLPRGGTATMLGNLAEY